MREIKTPLTCVPPAWIEDADEQMVGLQELVNFTNAAAAREAKLREVLEMAEEALVDLGACADPQCDVCPRVLSRVREALSKGVG